jgi:peroxiredoxin family protein
MAMVEDSEGALSLVLFSGTDDKLTSAAILAVGAAAMGRRVNIFLQYWALDAFRSDRIRADHGSSPEATPEQADRIRAHKEPHWSENLASAKELGEVRINACPHSMETLGITADELDPLVDGVVGVATFFMEADGPITFI